MNKASPSGLLPPVKASCQLQTGPAATLAVSKQLENTGRREPSQGQIWLSQSIIHKLNSCVNTSLFPHEPLPSIKLPLLPRNTDDAPTSSSLPRICWGGDADRRTWSPGNAPRERRPWLCHRRCLEREERNVTWEWCKLKHSVEVPGVPFPVEKQRCDWRELTRSLTSHFRVIKSDNQSDLLTARLITGNEPVWWLVIQSFLLICTLPSKVNNTSQAAGPAQKCVPEAMFGLGNGAADN